MKTKEREYSVLYCDFFPSVNDSNNSVIENCECVHKFAWDPSNYGQRRAERK